MKKTTDEFSFVVKPSLIKGGGVGVFAVHDIKKDTKLDLYDKDDVTRIVDSNEIPKFFHHYCIFLPNNKLMAPKKFNHMWIVWYLNHSNKPNAELNKDENCYYSVKDIQEGEEILIDYNAFDEPENLKAEYYRKKVY